MFERPNAGERVIIVHLDFQQVDYDDDHQEFKQLVASTDVSCAASVTGRRLKPDPKFFIGSGKVDDIRDLVKEFNAAVIIFNHRLSPAQERNLERHCCARVLDRTGLILDIFARRARSFEGKLQVELAQLQHLSTRLVRGWTHLERQKGGIGLRGPGETQLETDRRLLRKRIDAIHRRLAKVSSQRQQARKSRKRRTVPSVALVGYTNAGKSSLFNRLVDGEVYAADQLFATLDPTLRRLHLPNLGEVVLADTVGFIRDLPTDLINAFHATLEETRDADLLLHVIDCADPLRQDHAEQVNAVLKQLGADAIPQLLVMNKIDLREDLQPGQQANTLNVSALSGDGIDALLQQIEDQLYQHRRQHQIVLSPEQAALRAELFRLRAIIHEVIDEAGNYHLDIILPEAEFNRLQKKLQPTNKPATE